MVKPGPMPPGEHNKVESKKLHKVGRFPKLRAARKAFSQAKRASGHAPLFQSVCRGLERPPAPHSPSHCGYRLRTDAW